MARTRWITLDSRLTPPELLERLEAKRVGRRRPVWPRVANAPLVLSVSPERFVLRAIGFWKAYGIVGTAAQVEEGTRVVLAVEPVERFAALQGVAVSVLVMAALPMAGIALPFWVWFGDANPAKVGGPLVVAAIVLAAVVSQFTQPEIPESDLTRLRRSLFLLLDAREPP